MPPRRQVSAGDSARKPAIVAHCADGAVSRNTPVVELGHDPQQQRPHQQRIAGNRQHHRVLGRGHDVLAVPGTIGRRGERSPAPGPTCQLQALPGALPRRVRRAGQPRHQGLRCERAAQFGVDEHGQALVSPIGLGAQRASPRRILRQQHGELGIELTGQERQQPPARMPPRTRWLQVQRRARDFDVEIERQAFLPAETIRAGRHPREGEQRQLEGVDRFCGRRGGRILRRPRSRDCPRGGQRRWTGASGPQARATVSPGDSVGRPGVGLHRRAQPVSRGDSAMSSTSPAHVVRSACPRGDSVGGPVVELRGDALPVSRGDSARIVIGARVTLTRRRGGGYGPDRRCNRCARGPRPQFGRQSIPATDRVAQASPATSARRSAASAPARCRPPAASSAAAKVCVAR